MWSSCARILQQPMKPIDPMKPMKPKPKPSTPKVKELELTTNQKRFVTSINSNKKLVFLDGPAGSGKTLLSCRHAIEKLSASEINNVVITRPAISIQNEQHGYLPGDLNEKMSVWVAPLLDNFTLFESERRIKQYINDGQITIVPLAFMRGLTFDDCVVIGDEMQNSTKQQMQALLTRIGDNCQMIITGDGNQSDVTGVGFDDSGDVGGTMNPDNTHNTHNTNNTPNNGFMDFIEKYESTSQEVACDDIDVVKFDEGDIKRSEIVKFICGLYSR